MPAPHHSVFCRPDTLPATQPMIKALKAHIHTTTECKKTTVTTQVTRRNVWQILECSPSSRAVNSNVCGNESYNFGILSMNDFVCGSIANIAETAGSAQQSPFHSKS